MKSGKLTQRLVRRLIGAARAIEGSVQPMDPRQHLVKRKPPQQLFAVRVSVDGGAAGDATTTCTWTYTVTLDSGFELGTGMTPEKCRLPMVPYVETADETWGAGFFDKVGAFVLWDANECPVVAEC